MGVVQKIFPNHHNSSIFYLHTKFQVNILSISGINYEGGQFIHQPIHPTIHPSDHPSIRPSIHPTMNPSNIVVIGGIVDFKKLVASDGRSVICKGIPFARKMEERGPWARKKNPHIYTRARGSICGIFFNPRIPHLTAYHPSITRVSIRG